MLIACCLIQFGGLGVLSNSIGVFFPAICADMGFTTAQISFHITIRGLASVAALPLAGVMLSKYRSRYILTPAAILLVCSIGSMSFFSELWQWYVASIFYGFAGAFLFLIMSPLILTNWFKSKTGFAVGMAMAFSGLGGIVMNPVGNMLIGQFGWRTTYLIFACIGAFCMIPFTAFVLERRPEDIGELPYTDGNGRLPVIEDRKEIPKRRRFSELTKRPVLWVFLAIVMIVAFETVFIYHFPAYTLSIGLSTAVGSMMSSASMAGNLFGKFGLGWLNDRLNAKRTFLLGIILTMTGIAIIQTCGRSLILLTIGSGLYGVCMALTSVSVPMLILGLFDQSAYASLLSLATMIISAMGGVGTVLIGLTYDASGGYTAAFWLAQALCGICALLLLAAFAIKRIEKNKIGRASNS
jgi:MFS family permease